MIIINTPSEVVQLPLADDVICALIREIEQPFESAIALTLFWKQTRTTLRLLEANDDPDVLSKSDPALAFALEYPEWTIDLPGNYQLSLAVTNDEGGGCYLLRPAHLIKPPKD